MAVDAVSRAKRRPRRVFMCALILAAAGALGTLPAAGRGGNGAGTGPTRADLDAARRRLARLESEYALARTRKPYLVLDAGARLLQVRLLGMTVREVPILSLDARGLRPAREAPPSAPLRVAGIATLREKEGDPRLAPLSAEEIEAGADDENVADALPPEPPAVFRMFFRQSVVVPVESRGGQQPLAGTFSRIGRRLARALGRGRRPEESEARLVLAVHLDETNAHELYRLLLPGERLLILPPPGLILPDLGQEPPKSLKPAQPSGPPREEPKAAPGVPFRIPPPVATGPPAPGDAGEAVPAEEQPPAAAPGSRDDPVPAVRLDAPRAGSRPGETATPDPGPAEEAPPAPTPTP